MSKLLIILPLILLTACCGSSVPSGPRPVAGSGDETLACIMAQKFMADRLKAPASAKFAPCNREAASFAGDGEFIVSSYVDAQNSFGALIRTSFVMRVKSLGNDQWRMLQVVTSP